jgi:hypothetical protein
MTTLKSPALTIDARYNLHKVPSERPATYSTTYRTDADVTVRLSVDDKAIRSQVDGFDGMERPFAMLPSDKGGTLTWFRHELKHRGAGVEGFFGERPVDVYELAPVHNVDLEAVKMHGVAIGLETNVGTLWAQKPGENTPVVDDRALWK